ncbi:hypothetical protein CYMTET_36071 [Cymbomonas tetramitiformis]|uniref:C-type lectin domain-containing protein n=1 Tax=Cymbomonas tetramitiformis TaxID=36881 RepID=A0AAE0F7Z7_9CHLO|nr:hypothetical protein CYMTET_36071 [Cymbomonas tetramitiformis]
MAAGGDLASITSSGLNNFVEALTSSSSGIFIGGWATSGESTWYWSDGSTFSYTNWNSGEPSRGSEDCMVLRPAGNWNDLPCSYAKAYICQYTLTTVA